MAIDDQTAWVSVHGGHCAQFCSHARDRLDEVFEAYAGRGFSWVGITEHMPAAREAMLAEEERAEGLDVAAARDRFGEYFRTARALQREFADRLEVFVAFEAEVYSGYEPFLTGLIEEFRPDYVVGSVHHVHDIPIDYSPADYARAVERSGDVVSLYCDYFDLQYALVRDFDPSVVGHFDLIRLLDPGYPEHLAHPRVWECIERNLALIAERGSILDFNVRALAKGQPEPYVSAPILRRARELGIDLVPGDDSHGVEGVGAHCEEGIRILTAAGFPTDWRRPVSW